MTIAYQPDARCLESKSVKLYLSRFRNDGVFCEALAVQIRDDVAAALEPAGRVTVTLVQKARGGITITAEITQASSSRGRECSGSSFRWEI